jgi:hypothetical protein
MYFFKYVQVFVKVTKCFDISTVLLQASIKVHIIAIFSSACKEYNSLVSSSLHASASNCNRLIGSEVIRNNASLFNLVGLTVDNELLNARKYFINCVNYV